ncbi:hypothetical protein HRW07_12995 [Streptomyces lunaelactis]|uniref:hypothetical protein n=1 Tax=Streptomyces lunaelactis TaxID=1535768 RepID=UPI0015846735|nr:hypothetical protein [Streptomyces lunaelactis]NUL04132.1 hypothetical protein [Streptomyces lunaelactis]
MGAGYSLWSYKIESTGPGSSGGGELPAGERIALGLPREMDVRGPEQFPGIPQLEGIFIQRDAESSRQYVGRAITSPGPQIISFIAPTSRSTREVLLAKAPQGQSLVAVRFATSPSGALQTLQRMETPVEGPPVFNGRPPADFTGSLPYASEMFAVFQPLAGWFGQQNSLRAVRGVGVDALRGLSAHTFSGASAPTLDEEELAALADRFEAATRGVLSPVGLANLFRQYFFEFDTFLGPPAGHLWLSPGGTVELVETSTRRMLVEKITEQAEETSRKVEESLSEQDDVADAVKEENANDTNLGISLTGGVNSPVYHADASMSFGLHNTVKRSSEQTHKRTRMQSSKVTSEIKRNFKTTFKTVTESTDTSSRRYVVQNTSNQLVNYELRRKMRKVGVQLQHIGTRLCWQVYLDEPGRDLGVGDLVHVVPAPDLSSVKKPEVIPYPDSKQVTYQRTIPFLQHHGGEDDTDLTYVTSDENINHGINRPDAGDNNIILFRFDFPLPPPPPGFDLSEIGPIDFHGAQVKYTIDADDLRPNPDPAANKFALRLTFANFGGKRSLPFDVVIIYKPTSAAMTAIDKANADAKAAYEKEVAELHRQAYGNAVRERLKLISAMRPRPSNDLRDEERHTVYGTLINKLRLFEDPHLGSELIRQIFDVDEMLYLVAPDYWRPGTVPTLPSPPPARSHATVNSVGKYPVPVMRGSTPGPNPNLGVLEGQTVVSWYNHTDKTNAIDPQGHASDEWRVNYLVTEQTHPAPLGSSLGWLIQADGDVRRNQFLNAAWVKAILPVRPGHELEALEWLAQANVEGQAALGLPYPFQPGDPPAYQGKTVREVLKLLAADLQASNDDFTRTLAAEKVFETGFDPLDGGFRPANPYEVFDQWVEVLPTDQVVAVQVSYDPKTGQQL